MASGSGGTGPGTGKLVDKGNRRKRRRKLTFGSKAMPEHRLGDQSEKGGDNSFNQVGNRNGVRIFERKDSPYKWARGKDNKFHPIEGSRKPKPKAKAKGPTTPRDPYASQVNAAAELQYGPQEREIAYQRVVEAQRGVNSNSWYTQHYQRALQQAQATQAGSLAAQQGAYAQANQQFGQDTAANQQLNAQQNASAAMRGTSVDPALQQQAQQGAAQRQQQQTQFGNLTGQLGQNEAGYASARTVQASEQGLQAGADNNARQRKVEALSRELLADKQAFKTSKRTDLVDAQWKRDLEAKAFNLDVSSEAADQADDAADNARMSAAEKRQQREARSRIRDRRHDNNLADSKEQRIRDQDLADDGRLNGSSGGDSDGSGDFTPTQVRNSRTELQNGQSIANRYRKKGYDWLVNSMVEKDYDYLMARVIAARATGRPVPQGLLRKFRNRYGFLPKSKKAGYTGNSVPPRNPDGTPG